jgi:hypothetical protein
VIPAAVICGVLASLGTPPVVAACVAGAAYLALKETK